MFFRDVDEGYKFDPTSRTTTYSITQPYLKLKVDADWQGYFTTDFFVLHRLSKEKFIKLKKNEKD